MVYFIIYSMEPIYNKMEHISSVDNKDYYLLSTEAGFTNKSYAKYHKLYEFFGKSYSSTFYEIYTKKLYENDFLTQVWVFENDKPIALGIGVQFEPIRDVIYQNNKIGEILGQIQLYVNPEFRKMGIAKNITKILDRNFLANEKGLVILQDDAFYLNKSVSNLIPVPYNYKEKLPEIAVQITAKKIQEMKKTFAQPVKLNFV